MPDENGQKFDMIMSGIAEIKAEVRTLVPQMALVEKRHQDCEKKKVFEQTNNVKDMRSEGVWDAINSEKLRRSRRKIWYSVTASIIVASAISLIKLLQILSGLTASVGGG